MKLHWLAVAAFAISIGDAGAQAPSVTPSPPDDAASPAAAAPAPSPAAPTPAEGAAQADAVTKAATQAVTSPQGAAAQEGATAPAPSSRESGEQPPDTTPALAPVDPSLVRSVQRALEDQGYAVPGQRGRFGTGTQTALLGFQKARGLRATGALDAQTLAALGVKGGSAGMAAEGEGTEGVAEPAQAANPPPAEPPEDRGFFRDPEAAPTKSTDGFFRPE